MPPPEGPPTEDVAVARKILIASASVVALVFARSGSAELVSWPVLLRLGRALHAVAGNAPGIIRAPLPWSAERTSGAAWASDGSFELYALASPEGAGTGLTELVLPPAPTPHEAAANLARAVGKARDRFPHLLLDLSPYLPETREVLDLPDAFVSAAMAGRTRERELRALVESLPTSRHLGTLLLDRS
jgi:hypothetical protein